METITRNLSQEFLDLLESHKGNGISQAKLAGAIGLNPSQMTNLIQILKEIVRKESDSPDEYVLSDASLMEAIELMFEDSEGISFQCMSELGTFVKGLRNFRPEYNNFKLQFKKTSLDELFFALNANQIRQIDVIGHTGELLVKRLLNFLKDEGGKEIKIRILIRSRESETGIRQDGIKETIRDVHDLKMKGYPIHLLFYENLPTHRAVICYYKGGGVRTALLSSYTFMSDNMSRSSDYGHILTEKGGRHYAIDHVLSWFNHFWGKAADEAQMIYALVLDFDDSIIQSHTIQIQAWLHTILMLRKQLDLGKEFFQDAFQVDEVEELTRQLTMTFFEQQHATRIIDAIFRKFPENWPKEKIDTYRFEERKRLMLDPEGLPDFFDGFVSAFQELRSRYHLIILSATDEQMIRTYFFKKQASSSTNINFLNHFQYIFGKNEPSYEWEHVKHKSQILLKISKILGIPIERMVYVGDNHGDWVASSAIGMDFIEARLFSKETYSLIGKQSLIEDEGERSFFTHWAEFADVLFTIEEKKQKAVFGE